MSWIAAELGLTLLAETGAGVRVVAAGATTDAQPPPATAESLERAVARKLGGLGSPAGEAALAALIERARAGEASATQLQGAGGREWRLLAGPAGPDRAELMIVPASLIATSELQRRAALSDMAAAVSHEVSNALSAISGWVELLQQSPGDGERQAQTLERIGRCAKAAQSIARRLLDVARERDEPEKEHIEVSELVRDVGELLQLSARHKRVTLDLNILGASAVRAVRADLFSAVWNLAKNAIEACEAGDRVMLRVATSGDYVELSVVDNGPGMDADTLARAFTPYFSTKSAGTGIGLALVQQAVRGAGGEVEAHSTKGQGSRFVLRLPRSGLYSDTYPQVSMRVARALPSGQQPLAGVSVLIVDDDEALREMTATALELKGAEVTVVDGRGAAAELPGPYAIALIDMMLSDCRGDELLADLRAKGSVDAAILVSGVVNRPRLVPGGEPDDWVRKPFEISLLVDRIRQTLERHRMLSAAAAGQLR